MTLDPRPLTVRYGTKTDYEIVWRTMRRFTDARGSGSTDELWLVEHPAVYTLGQAGRAEHILDPGDIPVVRSDRGGQVTYHGPGQLVGYTIFDIGAWYQDVFRFLRNLEVAIIRLLGDFDVEAYTEQGITGVWVSNRKVAALGIKVSWWVSMHGFSVNVNPDLSMYDGIVPCGISDRKVTSLEEILGGPVLIEEVEKNLIRHLGDVFEMSFQEMKLSELLQRI